MNGHILEGVIPLRRPVVPYRGLRPDDKYGSGKFGAPRNRDCVPCVGAGCEICGGDGKIYYEHPGSDHTTQAGDTIISPPTGEVTFLGYAYPDTRAFRSIHILGKPPYDWCRVRLLYVSPNPSIYVGRRVCTGEEIATAQDISMRYEGITPHVHIDLWVTGKDEPNRWRRVDFELYAEKVSEA